MITFYGRITLDNRCERSIIILHNFHVGRIFYPLNRPCVYIEMACNGVFGAGNDGVINPPKLDRTFQLEQAELIVRDEDVFQLICDFQVLIDLAKVRLLVQKM